MNWIRIDNIIMKLENIDYIYSTSDDIPHVNVVFKDGKLAELEFDTDKEAEDMMIEAINKLNEVNSGS